MTAPDPIRALKCRLRTEALARRDALDPQWRLEASLEMAKVAQLIEIARAAGARASTRAR